MIQQVNIPVDPEWPIEFRQKIDGNTYTFTFRENDLLGDRMVEVGVAVNGEQVIQGRPLHFVNPVGQADNKMGVNVYALADGSEPLRPTKSRIRGRDVKVYAATK